MRELCPAVTTATFDGEAISQADREFLKSLGDHPLARHPLYSVPPPPRPNYEGCTTITDRQAAQELKIVKPFSSNVGLDLSGRVWMASICARNG